MLPINIFQVVLLFSFEGNHALMVANLLAAKCVVVCSG
uniref:Uncharacterized protein n=1 Tax=Arundo donax TaxID=35708 RepID=A0A0A9FUH5_ARUDO